MLYSNSKLPYGIRQRSRAADPFTIAYVLRVVKLRYHNAPASAIALLRQSFPRTRRCRAAKFAIFTSSKSNSLA